MTLYGWDSSHYDGNLTLAVLRRAKAEGISLFAHKIGEGLGAPDVTSATALAAARDAGIPVIGAYWFCHNADDPVAEADRMVARADADESWWREFPGWFWMADCETEGAEGKPARAWIQRFADRLVATTGRVVLVYASRGQYGDTLAGLTHPLWNAAYPSDRQAGFVDLYPGDSKSGWTAYSGQTPALWQYSSSATIAGRTTCDANAFRGTLDDLLALIGAKTDVELTDKLPGGTTVGAALDLILSRTNNLGPWEKTELDAIEHQGTALASAASVKALSDKLDEVLAALKAPTVGITIGAGDLAVSGTLHVAPPAVG